MIMGLLEKLIGNEKQKECKHLGGIKGNIKPKLQVCEECGKAGSLRVCLTCGHMGCCDSSIGQHARKAFPENWPCNHGSISEQRMEMVLCR